MLGGAVVRFVDWCRQRRLEYASEQAVQLLV